MFGNQNFGSHFHWFTCIDCFTSMMLSILTHVFVHDLAYHLFHRFVWYVHLFLIQRYCLWSCVSACFVLHISFSIKDHVHHIFVGLFYVHGLLCTADRGTQSVHGHPSLSQPICHGNKSHVCTKQSNLETKKHLLKNLCNRIFTEPSSFEADLILSFWNTLTIL